MNISLLRKPRKITFFLFFVLTNVCLSTKAQTYFYYNGSGVLSNTANWGTNTNGTGTAPTDFITASQIFIIQNTNSITFSGTWTVSGTGSKIVMGNPTSATASPAITLTLTPGSSIIATPQLFEVSIPSSGNHKIIYQNTTALSLGTVNDANLELVFDGAVITTSTTRTYGNVSLINNANIDMGGAAIILNNLTVDASSVLTGPIGSSAQYIAVKSGGAVVINGTFKAGRQGSAVSPSVGGLFSTGINIPVTVANSNATILFQDPSTTPSLTLGPNSTIDYNRGITSGQTGIQGITPWAYANLTLSNSGFASNRTFSIAGNITVSGTLTINMLSGATITQPSSSTTITLLPKAKLEINSATILPTNGKLILKSDATGTASIGALATGASITGNVTVEQFISAGSRKFRFLSHPFNSNQKLNQITDNIDITGNTAGTTGQSGQITGDGFTSTSTNNPSAFFFNTVNANGNATTDAGWAAFNDTATANWNVGQGIRVLTRGTKGQAGTLNGTNLNPNSATLDMTGVINQGTVNVNLVTGGSGATAGFNLVGNPYASPVDIGAVLSANTNIGSSIYLRNPQTGSYITVNPIPPSYILPAYSAFFVKANAATTLTFNESNKSTCVSCPTLFRASNATNHIEIKAIKDGLVYDNLNLNLGKEFSNNYEASTDAIKLLNAGLSIYSLSFDQQKLATDHRLIYNNAIVPLGIMLNETKGIETYTLKVGDFNIKDGYKLILHDKLFKKYILLDKESTYDLTIDPTNKKSVGEDRLEIIIKK